MTDARKGLIKRNSFMSTREVVDLLDAGYPPIGRDEMLVLRQWGQVLAVPDHGRWLYPTFQFRNGRVSPFIFDLHDRLRRNRNGQDADPWIELTFWSVERPDLEGQAVKDLLWRQRDARVVHEYIASSGY
jgi:hypothetical protein